jgi:transcriptional regulator with XRE-family HTH domain
MATMTPMQIMDRIRKALRADDRTSAEIAAKAGMDAVNVRQFKAGIRTLPLDTLCKLAAVLGLEIRVEEKRRV